jgi:proteasome lid subunit RPN8/RPN11
MATRPFGFPVDAAIREHALREYPRECCGLVMRGGLYVPMENKAPDPEEAFEVDTGALMQDGVLALVHSHTDAPAAPSAADMEQQIATGITWGLISTNGNDATPVWWWGGGIPTPPLLGREFRHGPSGSDGKGDCYALIRDWYLLERKIDLPEFPRDDTWWHAGRDLYRDNFAKAGFVQVSPNDARPGDVVLAHVLSPVVNHGGIYLGNGLILHHLPSRLSREEPLARWMSLVTHFLRHESAL